VLLLTRADVQALLDMDACIDALDDAFRAHAENRTLAPGVLGTHVEGGGFHVKTAGLTGDRAYYAAKINGNFPGNPSRHGLPTIQGVITLHDPRQGRLLALMDSIEITTLRTAAATALAARYMARTDATDVCILGCGNQGRSQLRALSRVRSVRRVFAWDLDADAARAYADEMTGELHCDARPVADYRSITRDCDIIVTCTPSREALLDVDDVAPGTFVAAVGADAEEKQELSPALMARSIVVPDILEQSARIGDLHHALDAGVMTRADIHGEVADVVSGHHPIERLRDRITIFDSTGTALEDVAAAARVYERAVSSGRGIAVDLNGAPTELPGPSQTAD
jgi:alanine dehydrogenase